MLIALLLWTTPSSADGWGGEQIDEGDRETISSSLSAVEASTTKSLEAAGGGVAAESAPYSALVVQGALRSAWPGLVSCYAASGLEERVDVDLELRVDAEGHVEAVDFETELPEELDACVREQALLLRFPGHEGPPVLVTAPIWLG